MNTQFENVGDALINREMIRLILEHSEVTLDMSATPAAFINEIFADVDRKSIRLLNGFPQLLSSAVAARIRGRPCHFFYLPGGITGEKSAKSMLSSCLMNQAIGMLAAINVRVHHLGASYSGLGPRNTDVVRARVHNMRSHMVRDTMTRDYVAKLGIRVDGLIPDFSFALYDRPMSPNQSTMTAFSFRLDRSDEGVASDVEKTITDIIAHGEPDARYRFVSQVRRDDLPMQALAKKFAENYRGRVEYRSASTIMDAFALYRDVGRLYSNRLHALLMAAYVGAVPVACIHPKFDAKIEGQFADLGLRSNIIVAGERASTHEPVTPEFASFEARAADLRSVFATLFGS